jgi:hypothetical protein
MFKGISTCVVAMAIRPAAKGMVCKMVRVFKCARSNISVKECTWGCHGLSENCVSLNPMDNHHHHHPYAMAIIGGYTVYPIFRHLCAAKKNVTEIYLGSTYFLKRDHI